MCHSEFVLQLLLLTSVLFQQGGGHLVFEFDNGINRHPVILRSPGMRNDDKDGVKLVRGFSKKDAITWTIFGAVKPRKYPGFTGRKMSMIATFPNPYSGRISSNPYTFKLTPRNFRGGGYVAISALKATTQRTCQKDNGLKFAQNPARRIAARVQLEMDRQLEHRNFCLRGEKPNVYVKLTEKSTWGEAKPDCWRANLNVVHARTGPVANFDITAMGCYVLYFVVVLK